MLFEGGSGAIVTTPATTTIGSQYAEVIAKLHDILGGTTLRIISAVPTENGSVSALSLPEETVAPILILYETAEDAVARGLLKGILPSKVLAKWITDAAALLSQHRGRRRQATLASIGSVLTEPAIFVKELRNRLKELEFSEDKLSPVKPVGSALQGLLARQIVSSDPVATRLSFELEAAALPTPAVHYDCDVAASELNAPNLETECTLLRAQITHLQQAIQEHESALAAKQQQFSATYLALTAAQDRVDGLEATLKGLTVQSARDRANLDQLAAKRQQLLQEFGQIMHRVLNGSGLMSWPINWRKAEQLRIVRDCGLIDPDWYLKNYPDVAQAGLDPFKHYINHGAKEGRVPNESFS